MRRGRRFVVVVGVTLLAVALAGGSTAQAQAEQDQALLAAMFVTGISGSTPVYGLEFALSVDYTGGAGGGNAPGHPTAEIGVVRGTDAVTPTLFLWAALGSHVQRVTIEIYAPGTPTYPGPATVIARYQFDDVVFTKLQTDGYRERLSLAAARVWIQVDRNRTCYDFVRRKKC